MATLLRRGSEALATATDVFSLSVLSVEKKDGPCPACGETGFLFVCHGFGLPDWTGRKQIQHRCRRCAIADAGGEARVWVRTTVNGLRQTWSSGRRLERSTEAARAARQQAAKRAADTS